MLRPLGFWVLVTVSREASRPRGLEAEAASALMLKNFDCDKGSNLELEARVALRRADRETNMGLIVKDVCWDVVEQKFSKLEQDEEN